MSRPVSVVLVFVGLLTLSVSRASAQEAACKPLYDAARKAHDQPGVERTITLGDPAKPDMTMQARKTATGWYQRMGAAAWRAMPIDPDAGEQPLLDGGKAFTNCAGGATEPVNGEAARVWSYVATIGPTPVPSRMWISVSRGLPLKVQGDKTLQISTYQATPFPKP